MGSTQVVSENDIGRTICCQVAVTDSVTNETVTVVSEGLGPINRPTIPEFTVLVEGQVWEDPNEMFPMEINQSILLEVSPELNGNLPLDLAYEWKLRSNTAGRLSGDINAAGIVYIAPGEQGTSSISCTASSSDADDSAFAAQVIVIYSEPDPDEPPKVS